MDEKLSDFVRQLNDTAMFLLPHIDNKKKGQRIWNGERYIEYHGEEYEADFYSRLWYVTLTVLAEMIQRQESKLTTRQSEYIGGLLFGGIGSFNDYSLSKAFQQDVTEANQILDALRKNLYTTFKQLNAS